MSQDEPGIELDTSLGYLLKAAASALHSALEAVLKPLGMTITHYACLELLAQRPGLSNSELARGAFVTRQSMNVLLQALERQGLVVRPAQAPVGRVLPTELTARGRRQLKVASAAVRRVEQDMLANLDVSEQDQMRRLLTACIASLTEPPASLRARLALEGFIAADDEAAQLLGYASGNRALLDAAVRRRLTGEPLAWIIGKVSFCGVDVRVDREVYVPRWLTEPLAQRAVERLPEHGTAVDVCTGTGAIAAVLRAQRPHARIAATDVDPRAAACAASNGVEVYLGDLFAPLPAGLEGRVDVVVGVVPYVPTSELAILQRDTFTFERPLAYDGGADGADILRRVLVDARRFLKRGGSMLLEVGGDQADLLESDLVRLGYVDVRILADEDGDVRGIEATVG
jgi:release factor glutamine methyltransferase